MNDHERALSAVVLSADAFSLLANVVQSLPKSSELLRTGCLDEDAGDRGVDDDLLTDRLNHDPLVRVVGRIDYEQ